MSLPNHLNLGTPCGRPRCSWNSEILAARAGTKFDRFLAAARRLIAALCHVVTLMKESVPALRDGGPNVICSATARFTTGGNAATVCIFHLVTLRPIPRKSTSE